MFGEPCPKSCRYTRDTITFVIRGAGVFRHREGDDEWSGTERIVRALGMHVQIDADSSTARRTASGKGGEKVRRVDVMKLWIQEKKGYRSVGGIVTMHGDRRVLDIHMQSAGFVRRT